jgi:hypothetical protein
MIIFNFPQFIPHWKDTLVYTGTQECSGQQACLGHIGGEKKILLLAFQITFSHSNLFLRASKFVLISMFFNNCTS